LPVAAVAVLALTGHIQIWHIYAMGVILGLAAFMFWSNLAALAQELTESHDVVPVNALVMGGAQAGWMLAGALVGFLYQHIGLGGVLALDACSYALSAGLMFALRKGKHLVRHEARAASPESPFSLVEFNREFIAGLRYTLSHSRVLLMGGVSAIFTAAMMSQNVLTAPLNMKILRTGSYGFGFCNAGWSLGAIFASGYAGTALRHGGKELRVLWVALLLCGLACAGLPYSVFLAVAVAFYYVMGAGRALAGVGVSSALMREVPKVLMGRTQNVFTFAGIVLQLILTMGVGWLAERFSLISGFFLVGGAYGLAGLLAWLASRHPPLPAPGEIEAPVFTHVEPAEM
jgi:MFS family permease